MAWIKDGKRVTARYLGSDSVTGLVVESRVRYGGKVSYTVILDKPVQFRWRSEPTTVVIVDENEIDVEFDNEVYSPFDTVNS
jgi:hypothetical protein